MLAFFKGIVSLTRSKYTQTHEKLTLELSDKDNVMGSFSITHWLILLVVVVVVFGTSKLRNAGKDLGGAVKGFKEAVKDEEKEHINKHRVLDHDADTPVGTKVDDIEISPAPIDEQHKV